MRATALVLLLIVLSLGLLWAVGLPHAKSLLPSFGSEIRPLPGAPSAPPAPFEMPEIPVGYFAQPVEHAMKLSGTFGELRPNHFHEGIDIKPREKEGEPIYASADGHVARVRTLPRGFGHVLYLDHPNGFTTIYAHLKSFSPLLQTYLRAAQNTARFFEVDLSPDRFFFSIKKGDLIGYIGNTGSSNGAHLHFEIRHTETDVPVNPLLFGFNVADTKGPVPKSVKLYALDGNGRETASKIFPLKKAGDRYVLPQDSIVWNADRVGIALQVNDLADGANNALGIYRLELLENGRPAFSFAFDGLSYDHTRYLNAHIDYREAGKDQWFHRCFQLPGNLLTIYSADERRGMLPLTSDKPLDLQLTASDVFGNSVQVGLRVVRGKAPVPSASAPASEFPLAHQDSLRIRKDGFEAFFPPGSVYESTGLKYTVQRTAGSVSALHELAGPSAPAHHWFDVAVRPIAPLGDSARAKAVVVLNGRKSLGGVWRDGWLWTKSQHFGSFSIALDDTPPTIELTGRYKGTPLAKDKVVFKITDDLSDLVHYSAWADNEWIVLEYDQKTRLFTLPFEDRLEPGTHEIRVEAVDWAGNRAEWRGQVVRQ